jgi:peptidoglycan hydrolase-like amidase
MGLYVDSIAKFCYVSMQSSTGSIKSNNSGDRWSGVKNPYLKERETGWDKTHPYHVISE